MSEDSWDPSEDIEAPTADAVEQRQPLPGEGEQEEQPGDFEVPIEANEADAAEQHMEVKGDDEDRDR